MNRLSYINSAQVKQLITRRTLRQQNWQFRGTGGISPESRCGGFLPAFLDQAEGAVYLSRFADGRPAPMHLLDGLPETLVVARTTSGRVTAVKDSVIAGFVRDGRFYTRDEAARAIAALNKSWNNFLRLLRILFH